jgi:RimJ/RimL family protein N-acetyltransferase
VKKIEAPKLETERLILRRRMEDDIPFMVKMFNTDEVRKYLGGYPPRDEHSMLKIIRHRNENQWVVTLRENNLYIGECWFQKIIDNYLGEIGVLFSKDYWGKGYAYEAVSKIIDYSIDVLKLKRLCARINNKNMRSIKLFEKLSFEFIALIPEGDLGGSVADYCYYTKKIN